MARVKDLWIAEVRDPFVSRHFDACQFSSFPPQAARDAALDYLKSRDAK